MGGGAPVRFCAVVTTALSLTVAAPAIADDASQGEKLFQEATALMDAGKHADALPKLIEAQRLDPGVGTQFNIAVCYEKLGKLGSAWRNYTRVIELAHASGKKPREEAARGKLKGLETRVPAFVVKTSDPDVTVKVDGAIVPATDLAFVPVDPGTHHFEAVAPAKKTWTGDFEAPPEGQRKDVVVPQLVTATVTQVVTKKTTEASDPKRTVAFAVGAVGVVAVLVGGAAGIYSWTKHDDAESQCPNPADCPTRDGADAWNAASTAGDISTVAFVVGGTALAGAGVLWLTSRKAGADVHAGPSGIWFVKNW